MIIIQINIDVKTQILYDLIHSTQKGDYNLYTIQKIFSLSSLYSIMNHEASVMRHYQAKRSEQSYHS